MARIPVPTRRLPYSANAPRWVRVVAELSADTAHPAKRLWATVLWNAIRELRHVGYRLSKDAAEWIAYDGMEPGDFEWVCEALDLEAATLRKDLLPVARVRYRTGR